MKKCHILVHFLSFCHLLLPLTSILFVCNPNHAEKENRIFASVDACIINVKRCTKISISSPVIVVKHRYMLNEFIVVSVNFSFSFSVSACTAIWVFEFHLVEHHSPNHWIFECSILDYSIQLYWVNWNYRVTTDERLHHDSQWQALHLHHWYGHQSPVHDDDRFSLPAMKTKMWRNERNLNNWKNQFCSDANTETFWQMFVYKSI